MTTTELIPIQETVSLPITVEQAKQQWDEYQRLTHALLHDTDYQKIGSRQFKKKSAWRKYARAFNITDRVTFEHIERAEDGFPMWARIRVEASHPNGRSAEADHECHVKERCCVASTGAPCEKRSWRGHTCCTVGCNGRLHWSHPGDLPATALTRAKNRAISDLIGAGEVSAEEMVEDGNVIEGQSRVVPPARAAGPPKVSRETQAKVVEAYDAVRNANPAFTAVVKPEIQKEWPHAFSKPGQLGQLTEEEAFDVLAYLEDQMPPAEPTPEEPEQAGLPVT